KPVGKATRNLGLTTARHTEQTDQDWLLPLMGAQRVIVDEFSGERVGPFESSFAKVVGCQAAPLPNLSPSTALPCFRPMFPRPVTPAGSTPTRPRCPSERNA